MSKPLVSVVIPAYNVENYLDECIKSVINQTYDNLEIILAVCSINEDSVLICQKYQEEDARVKIIEHAKPMRVGNVRNQGINAASGQYLMFVDGDDWLDENAVSRAIEAALKYNTNLVLFADYYYHQNSTELENHYDWKDYLGVQNFTDENLCKLHSTVWAKLYYLDFLKQHNIRYPENTYFEDNSFGLLVNLIAGKIAVINDKLYFYRRWGGGYSTSLQESYYGWIHDYYFVVDELKKRNLAIPKALYVLYFVNFLFYLAAAKNDYKKKLYSGIKDIIKTRDLKFEDFEVCGLDAEKSRYMTEYKKIKCLPFSVYCLYNNLEKILYIKFGKCIIIKLFSFLKIFFGVKIKFGKMLQIELNIGRKRGAF